MADAAMDLPAAYAELIRRTREDSLLASCAELLAWDEETYMPAGGVEHRANQLALLAGLRHAQTADRRLGELLGDARGLDLLADPHSASCSQRPRAAPGLRAGPARAAPLIEEIAHTTSLAQQEWALARRLPTSTAFARGSNRSFI